MDGKITLWPVFKDILMRCFSFHRFFLLVSPLVVFFLLSNTNPAIGWTPDWSMVKDEPFPLSDAPNVINPVLTARDVYDVNAEFVADPFLFRTDNKWYLFFEVLNKDRDLGEIGVATSDDGMVWDYSGIVLRENLHLSYPLVFEHNGTYYMIPDISGTTGVWLYEAVEFPFKWEYVTTLIDGRNYADATVFFYDGKWWMFAGEGWYSGRGNCYLFYSDDLLSGWTEHPSSPIVVGDAGIARPGGRAFVFDTNRVVRIAQKCDVLYGQRARAFEVDQLNETDYIEHEIPLSPILNESGNGWNASGMHHFSPWWTGNKWIAAVDGQNDDIWSIGIYVADSNCLLNSRFDRVFLGAGIKYYTDRTYTLTRVPSAYVGLDAILTPNDDRNLTTPMGYLNFEMPFDGVVYVAYDSRAISLPFWMDGFIDTGDTLKTSLSTQPSLKIYSKDFDQGECVNFGANKASGFSGDTVSNYLILVEGIAEGPPIIIDQPDSISVHEGQYATFSIVASGAGAKQYQWENNGFSVGEDSPTYTLPNCQVVDSGAQISCTVSNSFGPTASAMATLTVTPPLTCVPLDFRFDRTTLANGIKYYTDRDYRLTNVHPGYMGMDTILTPNGDRDLTTPTGYLNVEMPFDGMLYVAYDSRATSRPNWMNGFIDTGDVLLTSLSTQPSLKIYSQMFYEGDCVNLGANKAPGYAGGTVSNYIVFYSDGNVVPIECILDTKFQISTMAMNTYYYTDRNYTITGGIPDWMLGLMFIQPPNDNRFSTAASGYLRFTNPVSGWVYVLFDSRSASIPSWLNGWEMLSDKITTSLETQPYLKVYRKMFDAGQCVDLGGNYGPGSSGETRSNYVVVYEK
jgi:hypothetical protein